MLLEFPVKHVRNLCKRFAYNYLVRDFSVGTIQILAGLVFTAFGVTFGSISWIRNAAADRDTPVGTVIIATLPIILGFQLLLAALSFDIANIPYATDSEGYCGQKRGRNGSSPRPSRRRSTATLRRSYRKTKNFDVRKLNASPDTEPQATPRYGSKEANWTDQA